MAHAGLNGIPGVGRVTRGKLLAKFSPEQLWEAIRQRDVEAFTSRGFTRGFAIDLLRRVNSASKFLDTKDAREEYKALIRIISRYPFTSRAKDVVSLLYPLKNRAAAERRLKNLASAVKFWRELPKPRREALLSALKIAAGREVGREEFQRQLPRVVVATDDDGVAKRFESSVSVVKFVDASDLRELSWEHPFLRVVSDRVVDSSAGIETFSSGVDLERVVPELPVARLLESERYLRARAALSKVVPGRFKRLKELDDFVASLAKPDDKLERAKNAASMASEISERVLESLGETGHPAVPAGKVEALVSREAGFPVDFQGVDVDEVPVAHVSELVQTALLRERGRREFERASRLARLAKPLEGLAEQVEKEVVNFDYWIALARVVEDFDLHEPKFAERRQLFVRRAMNVMLTEQVRQGKLRRVDPVDYVLGKPPEPVEGVGDESVALVTGANSGGKSCLLQVVLQVVVLAHAGLFVPAEHALVPWLNRVIYHRRHVSRTAGALESVLKKFVPAFTQANDSLVLVDEFEAITEPGDAARILFGLISLLINCGALGAFVTHLSREVVMLLGPHVRVDAISAKGLDSNLELITDHQPNFGQLGRSTPELVVEKLLKSTSNKRVRRAYLRIRKALERSRVVWQTRVDWYLDKFKLKRRVTRVPLNASPRGGDAETGD
ncbi:MAG: hypothetical protein Kow0069_37970 [Promethearchaeota archaeon]